MKNALSIPARMLAVVLCLLQLTPVTSFAYSHKKKTVITPEISQQIQSARTVFLINSGSNPADFSQFQSSLNVWGHYKLVATPAEADLIFDLRTKTYTSCTDTTDDKGVSTGTSCSDTPYFELTLKDPSTLQPLWGISYRADEMRPNKHYPGPFPPSIANLTSQVKLVSGQALSPLEKKELADHHYLLPILLVASLAAAPVIVFSIRALSANKHCHPGVPCDVFK